MLSALIETTSQRVIATDPETLDRLNRLAGKLIAIDIKKVNMSFYLRVEKDNIAFQKEPEDTQEIDVRLKAKPSTLLKIARDGMEDAELEKGELEIDGDAITGQRFASMLNSLDIDWEELISEKIGDVPARLLFQFLEKASDWQTETTKTMKKNISEFLVEEAEIVSHADDIESFVQSVDVVRNDTARIEARLQQLEKRLS